MIRKRQSDVVFAPATLSRAMRELDRVLRCIAPKEVPVLLLGESGSGKEVAARRIHDLSPRRIAPFVPINCAAIPESLFESASFLGHEKGAFTGASERARGKLEAADGGTLFLDEIGEMPVAMQAKLLRFLENQRFMRVGGSSKISVDTRLVCATSKPLQDEVGAGRFRPDLFYRIQGITLAVPPLRERPADVSLLVAHFTQQLSAKHSVEPPKLGRSIVRTLKNYPWPGNVRELKNTLELLVLMRSGKKVRPRDLPDRVLQVTRSRAPSAPQAIQIQLDRPLKESILAIVRGALDAEAGNRTRAAERLGISVRTIQRYLPELP